MSRLSLLRPVRKALERVAQKDRAPAMQAYMKSAMPYHGVPIPIVRRLCKVIFADLPFSSAYQWQQHVLELWRNAQYREERYAALQLAGDPRARSFQTPAAMKLYEEMIVTGAWWDYVDEIAVHRVGSLLRQYPLPMKRKMLSWSKSTNIWKRRTSILCQLGFKSGTDLSLLYACIEPSLASPEFFLRKSIGWALRQYARIDPSEVKRYVRINHDRLSALSRREALKHVQ